MLSCDICIFPAWTARQMFSYWFHLQMRQCWNRVLNLLTKFCRLKSAVEGINSQILWVKYVYVKTCDCHVKFGGLTKLRNVFSRQLALTKIFYPIKEIIAVLSNFEKSYRANTKSIIYYDIKIEYKNTIPEIIAPSLALSMTVGPRKLEHLIYYCLSNKVIILLDS